MDASAPQILTALEGSGLGLAIRQSVWIYPAGNIGHVLAVVVFAGAVTLLDLILLGVVRVAGRGRLVVLTRRFAMTALAGIVLTGSILFIAEASHVALNTVFQLKLLLIIAALINTSTLGARAVAAAVARPDDEDLPGSAKAAAIASLCLWLGVAGLGRFIAYV